MNANVSIGADYKANELVQNSDTSQNSLLTDYVTAVAMQFAF
ncbi:hypothetical protein [Plesiomonas sp.]